MPETADAPAWTGIAYQPLVGPTTVRGLCLVCGVRLVINDHAPAFGVYALGEEIGFLGLCCLGADARAALKQIVEIVRGGRREA